MRSSSVALLVVLAGVAVVAMLPHANAQAIISSGSLKLGINPEGNLNVPGGVPSAGSGSSTTNVGLRFVVDGDEYESTAPGCLCEGWGYAFDALDESAGTTVAYHGYANEASCGTRTAGMTALPMTSTPSTATTIVQATVSSGDTPPDPATDPIGYANWVAGHAADPVDAVNQTVNTVLATSSLTNVKIQHDFYPDPDTSFAYHVDVTVTNDGDTNVTNLRYRRAMDWDVEPTAFSEYSSIIAMSPPPVELVHSDLNGFACSDPTMSYSSYREGPPGRPNIIDAGPSDHGAVFDFNLGYVAPHTTYKFYLFYGAAPTEDDALDAIDTLGIMVYSLGEQRDDPTEGTPATFFFGFGFIRIPVTPDANFDAAKSPAPCGDQPIKFTDTSTDDGTIVAWRWDFGDGESSTEGPVVHHSYVRDGYYNVTLNVTDNDGYFGETTRAVYGYAAKICPASPAGSTPPDRSPPDGKDGKAATGDADGDGVEDGNDDCVGGDPDLAGQDTDGDGTSDGCDLDIDDDGIQNGADNCPFDYNRAQANIDFDGLGDACDDDIDGDGLRNVKDNCPSAANREQDDRDGDAIGDACDLDMDGDGVADLRLGGVRTVPEERSVDPKAGDVGPVPVGRTVPIGPLAFALAAGAVLVAFVVAVGLARRRE